MPTAVRLFAETLEAVRGNFQVLFRKVFGGGNADIVLEDNEDILESGIEIVATPPGKHSLNLSLLSGGERALTAVTLLLAIFQYRPSPFCRAGRGGRTALTRQTSSDSSEF